MAHKEKEKQIGEQKYEPKYPIAITAHKVKHNEWRLIEFDDTARLDKLKSRLEVFGTKIVEKFGDRDDGLMERKISIVPDSSSSNSETELYKGGPKIEKMLGYTNLDSEKGFAFFQKFLKDTGILEELEEAGIQEGDTVRMYGLQFDYYK